MDIVLLWLIFETNDLLDTYDKEVRNDRSDFELLRLYGSMFLPGWISGFGFTPCLSSSCGFMLLYPAEKLSLSFYLLSLFF